MRRVACGVDLDNCMGVDPALAPLVVVMMNCCFFKNYHDELLLPDSYVLVRSD
jgi:hypothetical protein